MTHTLEPAAPLRDDAALLALTVVLILTTWSFFGRFSVVAATAGIATESGFGGGIVDTPQPPRARRSGGRRCCKSPRFTSAATPPAWRLWSGAS
jgi:hypothetical protein